MRFPHIFQISIDRSLSLRLRFEFLPKFKKKFDQHFEISKEAGHLIGHDGFEKELDIREFAQSEKEDVIGAGEYKLQVVIGIKYNKVDGTYLLM